MSQLAERLNALAEAGTHTLTFQALDLPASVVRDEVAAVAAGPFAPLLAHAVAQALEDADPAWADTAALFPAGFAEQSSLLAFNSALETLLDSPATAKALAKALNGALLDNLAETVNGMPLLAAARLEGAVRLAASSAVAPYRVWDTLTELPPEGPDDFLERLPRILGVALDCWAQQEKTVTAAVRDLLAHLSVDEASDVDALFELGCDRLRSALSASDLPGICQQMSEARSLFAAAEAAEEAREDATAYLAVCDAVLGFTAGDAARVASAASRIEQALERRAAWLHGTHQPSWMQPRRSAEIAWSRLLLQLKAASQHLGETAWLEPWQALDAVLGAYCAARTVQPLSCGDGAEGLAALIEPAIEDGFLRREALLNTLRLAAARPQGAFDHATAATIIARIDARESSPDAVKQPSGEDDEDPGGDPDSERLHRLAPTLVRRIGPKRALHLTKGMDDTAILDIEGLTHDSDVGRLSATDPLIVPTLDRFLAELATHEDFTGYVRQTFTVLVKQTLLFLKTRSDLTRTSLVGPTKKDQPPPFDYRRKPEKGQRTALEWDLQRDFHQWLLTGQLQGIVQVEPTDVGMGRADVMVVFGPVRYLTEIKKDASDNTRTHIESKYLTQEAEYTNTSAPFGQLLVLDLTPKTTTQGTRRINELAWLTTHRPKGATIDRCVLAGIVTGNRITPAAYSR